MKKILQYLLLLIFVIWFIGSMVGFFLVKENSSLFLLLFGQYFYVFSLMALSGEGDKFILVHFFIGYLLILASIIGPKYDRIRILLSDSTAMVIVPYVFALFLLLLSIVGIVFYFKKREKKYFWIFVILNVLSLVVCYLV